MNNKNIPLVTAVITTYKRGPNIVKRSLVSVLEQTYQNIEIYVVNDYPTDKTLVNLLNEMIGELEVLYNKSINYIVAENNGGACIARNLALDKAKGKYFACLDDDDEWLPDKIRLQANRMESNPQAAISYCNAIVRYDDQGIERVRFKVMQNEGNLYCDMISKNVIGSCSFPMFRTDILKQMGGFNISMPALQDWELYLRVLKKYDAVYVHEPVAKYYFYEGERISANPEKRVKAFETIHGEIQEVLKGYKKNASDFYMMGTYFYSFTNKKEAFSYYIKGVMLDPTNVVRNIKCFIRIVGRGLVKTKKV